MNEKKFSETISYLSMTFSLSQTILECFKFKLRNFGFIFNNSNIEKNRFLLWRASHKRETKFVCGFPFLWYSLNSGPQEGKGTRDLVPTMFWKLYINPGDRLRPPHKLISIKIFEIPAPLLMHIGCILVIGLKSNYKHFELHYLGSCIHAWNFCLLWLKNIRSSLSNFSKSAWL